MAGIDAVVATAAARLVRLPLPIAAAVAVLLVLDAFGMTGAFTMARIGVRALLAVYLCAGLLNLPRFPRTVRGPGTARTADRALLDLWSVIAMVVASAALVDGTAAGLL